MQLTDLIESPESIPVIAEWHHREWSSLNPGQSIDDRIRKMQCYLTGHNVQKMFIMKNDGAAIGTAAIVANDMDTRTDLSPWLASVYVEPGNRCRGYGTQLVMKVMEHARNSGYNKLYLFTPDKQSFYSNMGWSLVDREHYHGQSVSIMKYDLSRLQDRSPELYSGSE
jgi:N-acetylglutamate synthase-like GNAT family acetyltransferase